MLSINKATICGNIGQDPEVRTMQNGSKVCNLSIATNNSYKNKAGEKVEQTEWHRVVVFGDGLISKLIEPYVTKGSSVYVEGEIRTRKWTDNNGVDRYSTEIVVSGPGSAFKLNGGGNGKASNSQPAMAEQRDSGNEYFDDDLPM